MWPLLCLLGCVVAWEQAARGCQLLREKGRVLIQGGVVREECLVTASTVPVIVIWDLRSGGQTRAEIGKEIDAFLTPRLEWRVQVENAEQVILTRESDPLLLAALQAFSQLQFPEDDRFCSVQLVFRYSPHRLVGSMLGTWLHNLHQSTVEGRVLIPLLDGWYFTTDLGWDCGGRDGQLDCFFLPFTACTSPTADVPEDDHRYITRIADTWRIQNKTQRGEARHLAQQDHVHVTAKAERTRELWSAASRPLDTLPTAVGARKRAMVTLRLFWRLNWQARDAMQNVLEQFNVEHPDFPLDLNSELPSRPSPSCAVLHIRHGDKLTPFWMKRHKGGSFLVGVSDYVREARPLIKLAESLALGKSDLFLRPRRGRVPTIFLLTDDADIEGAVPNFTDAHIVLTPKARPLRSTAAVITAGGGFHYARKEGKSEAPFFAASFRIASSCATFVGNCRSGFSSLILNVMCAERGRCPLTFSFSSAACGGQIEKLPDRLLGRTCENPRGPNFDDVGEAPKICSPTSPPLSVPWRTCCGPIQTSLSPRPPSVECTHGGQGLIILNLLGRLGNNLFEIAMANRMAEQLCWSVVYRPAWQGFFPDNPGTKCFPNAIIGGATKTIPESLRDHPAFQGYTPESWAYLAQRHSYPKYSAWERSAGMTNVSLKVQHASVEMQGFHQSGTYTQDLVDRLNDPNSSVRVLILQAFFIHYDWMADWLAKIRHWTHMRPSCCAQIPSEETVVIHWRDFGHEMQAHTAAMQDPFGIYIELLRHFHLLGRPTWVICQASSAHSPGIQALANATNAIIISGKNQLVAMCAMRHARTILLSASSTFSQISALVGKALTVHYPLLKLDNPAVTIKVPHWRYHLVNTAQNGIERYDVDHSLINVRYA